MNLVYDTNIIISKKTIDKLIFKFEKMHIFKIFSIDIFNSKENLIFFKISIAY